MDDLINRQSAIKKIDERLRKLIYCFGPENDMVKIMDITKSIIIAIPPAQPEIIRCKDCKHLFNKDDEGGKCWHFNDFSKVVSYDDFCSLAERRTDGID